MVELLPERLCWRHRLSMRWAGSTSTSADQWEIWRRGGVWDKARQCSRCYELYSWPAGPLPRDITLPRHRGDDTDREFETTVAWIAGVALSLWDFLFSALDTQAWWLLVTPTLLVLATGGALLYGHAGRGGRGLMSGALWSAFITALAAVGYYWQFGNYD